MLYRRLVAKFYDQAMSKVESLCLRRWRSELLADLRGTLLEIGAGTGANLPHYSSALERLVLCEPDDAMRRKLESALRQVSLPGAEVCAWPGEYLEVEDASVDVVVSTLVLCSVANPQQTLREVFRVLKPGGQLVLMEHVAAQDARLYFWQQFWQPLWRPLACNCHLTRQTALLLESVGFQLDLRQEVMLGAPAVASPMIIGRATRL